MILEFYKGWIGPHFTNVEYATVDNNNDNMVVVSNSSYVSLILLSGFLRCVNML